MLRQLAFRLHIIPCDKDIESFINDLCMKDAANETAWGTPFFRAMLVSCSSHGSVLLLRINHAQYDAQSFSLILQDLT